MTPAETAAWIALTAAGLAGSAVWSGTETGFYCLSRVRLDVRLHRRGDAGARRVRDELDHPDRLLATILLGNNLCNYFGTLGLTMVLEGAGLLRPVDPTRDAIPAGGVAARTLAALGRPIHSRDLTATARRLVADGLAAWSTEPMPTASRWADEALDGVARRVRALAGLED